MLRFAVLTFALVAAGLHTPHSFAQAAPLNASSATQNTTLTVSISGLRDNKGQVMIQLWNQPNGFPTKDSKGYQGRNVDASQAVGGTVTVSFDVPPGTYAVSTLHDENNNNKMDTNTFGMPKEGYGASNNVISHLHAPSFEQARFEVPVSGQKISITMHY